MAASSSTSGDCRESLRQSELSKLSSGSTYLNDEVRHDRLTPWVVHFDPRNGELILSCPWKLAPAKIKEMFTEIMCIERKEEKEVTLDSFDRGGVF